MVNLECPNCGSGKITDTWIKEVEIKEKRKTFDKYAEERIKNPPSHGYFICNTMDYPRYVQFKLVCDDCGYTKVYEVNGVESK